MQRAHRLLYGSEIAPDAQWNNYVYDPYALRSFNIHTYIYVNQDKFMPDHFKNYEKALLTLI